MALYKYGQRLIQSHDQAFDRTYAPPPSLIPEFAAAHYAVMKLQLLVVARFRRKITVSTISVLTPFYGSGFT